MHRTCPLSGVKRTWAVALYMCAFDPKRTCPLPVGLLTATMTPFELRGRTLRRREFITLGGAAIAWPFAARAQTVQIRRVVVLMGTANDAEAAARATALKEGLQKLGWILGRNIQIDYRFAAGNAAHPRGEIDRERGDILETAGGKDAN